MNMHEMKVEEILGDLPSFEPLCYYDKQLDAIRVQIMDCSIMERRLDKYITIYHANAGAEQIVGFSIKGIKSLIEQLKSAGQEVDTTPLRLAELIDAIVKMFPSQSTRLVHDFFAANLKETPHIDLEAA